MNVVRHLFRDGVLIASGPSLRTFEEISKKGDLLLVDNTYKFPDQWLVYGITFYDNPTPRWSWTPLPAEDAIPLRALLLLQQ